MASSHMLWPSFKELHLQATKISDKGCMKLLSVFCQFTKLEVLNLDSNTGIGFKTANFMLKIASYIKYSQNEKLYL